MTIDKFGQYLYRDSSTGDINVEVKALIQNFLDLIQVIPVFGYYLPRIDLNNKAHVKAMSDLQLFEKYEKYKAKTKGTPLSFRKWFEEDYMNKKNDYR